MATNQNRIPTFEDGFETGNANRANELRRDNDTVKTPKITLYDIDYSILYHLAHNMKLKIVENGRSIDIPVIFSSGEKWAQIKSRGYMRDDENKVMAPLIVIRRTSVEADSRIPIMDLNNHVPSRRFYPYKTMNMQYDKLTGQSVRKPSYEFYKVDMPNFVRVSYELVVWTYMVNQMNSMVQAITAVSNHMWGDYHSFRTVVDNVSMNTTNNSGEDRLVSTTLSLTVDGRLLEEDEYHESTIRKAYTVKKVDFKDEQDNFDFYIDNPTKFNETTHISQEPKHIQRMKKRRNIRYR
tara:strand:- start:1774 stop:2658 length:885 start_codon:yes stop_codon:yes gene_type:complete